MAPHSSTLAWKIPGTGEPDGSLRVGHDWVTSLSLFTFMHWRRKWQPTPVFLPEPGWLPSMGSHRVGHYWSDLAAVAAVVFVRIKHSKCEKTSQTEKENFAIEQYEFRCQITFWFFSCLMRVLSEIQQSVTASLWILCCHQAPWTMPMYLLYEVLILRFRHLKVAKCLYS